MSRLDSAFRRTNVDVSRDTGAAQETDAAEPWHVDEVHENTEQSRVRRSELQGETTRASFWAGFDPVELERLVVCPTADPLLSEQFRSLATSLHGAQREQPIKSLVVTSATPGDGKSHVAINLALTLSRSFKRRVLLIDADLRRPTLHRALGVPNDRGLTEVLAGAPLDSAVTEVTENLTLLTAGGTQADPLACLASDRLKQVVAEAESTFDWVIVDSPPVGVLADARLVAETVDGALVVVRAGMTKHHDLEAATDMIGRERILGLVLNAVDPSEIRGEGYYREYYRADSTSG